MNYDFENILKYSVGCLLQFCNFANNHDQSVDKRWLAEKIDGTHSALNIRII